MTKISILGCGWLGLPLAKVLVKNGFSVKGSTTTQDKIDVLKQSGIEPFLFALNPENIQGNAISFLEHSEVLIINIPPKLRGNSKEDFVGKMKTLIPFIEKSSVEKVLFVSSTSVYADENVMTFGTKSITSNFFGGFVSKYNSRGTPMWAEGLYGSGKGICLDDIRSVYVTGNYRWPIAYFGSYSVTNNNTSNITNLYLAKLDSSASGLLLNSSFASADFTETITTSPNPFSNAIFIKIENQNIKSISINIRNTLGELVFIQNENKAHTPFKKQLDLSFLSGGIYFLEVITDGERLVKKVVKE